MALLYKLSKSVLPMLGLTLSIGMCYAFSLFSQPIADHLALSKAVVQFAFCLNILFLGLGAAIFGRLVEKKIKTAAWLSCILFFCGLCLSGLAMQFHSIVALYIGFGLCCGVAEGIGYVTPVLNNILWFGKNKHKGLVAALSIISFGLGSTLCSWLFKIYYPMFGIEHVFYAFAVTYLAMSGLGATLINKPRWAQKMLKRDSADFNYLTLAKDPYALRSWLYMFLNISAGLVLIGSCAPILKEVNLSQDMVIMTMMLCGIFNGAGRLVFPALSDFMKRRVNMLVAVLAMEILVLIPAMLSYSFMPIAIVIINATYGSFFALLPSVLSDHYGNKDLSTRHSAVLSAWGIASLFAYVLTMLVSLFSSYWFLTFVLAAVYVINLLNVFKLKQLDRVS